MDGQPQQTQQQQQQQDLAAFLGTTLDDVGHAASGGGDGGESGHGSSSSSVGASSPPPQPSSLAVLNFLRERGVNPDDYGWKDDRAALDGMYSYLAELARMNRQYEAQLAQLREAEKAKPSAQAAQTPAEDKEPDWEKLPEYDPTWRFRQNEPAMMEEMAKYARILQERNHKFHNNPIEYLRAPLDYYLNRQLKTLREEIEKKLEEGLRTVRYESQLPWFIEDRRGLLFDKSGSATKYNEAYMDVFNNLVQQGVPRDVAMQKAEELVNRVWTRAVESVSSSGNNKGDNAGNGGVDNQADTLKRRAVDRHNRVPNRNGSEPRSHVDGPQNPKLSTRKRHELAYDSFFANGGK